MAFAIDQEHLPAVLRSNPMSDAEFLLLCAEHPDLAFEMTADSDLIVLPASYSNHAVRNSEIIRQLGNWAIEDGRGVVTDSSTGFVLPNGARRSPDAAWIAKSRVAALRPEIREAFWHLCPDFVIELRSPSDKLRTVREKMDEYIANGATLAWLIDPSDQSITFYRVGADSETTIVTHLGLAEIQAESPVSGFKLQLARVWNPLA